MVGSSISRKKLWQYSHSASILFAVLLFTAGFLCVLLWTNDIVHTSTSAGDASTSTFTQFSPAVSTFSITYNVVGSPSSPLSLQLLNSSIVVGNLWYSVERHILRHATCAGG
jgi:hypothetical protein